MASVCCGANINGHVDNDGELVKPRPFDTSVCFYCTAWIIFDAESRPRLMTDADIGQLSEEDLAHLHRADDVINSLKARGLALGSAHP